MRVPRRKTLLVAALALPAAVIAGVASTGGAAVAGSGTPVFATYVAPSSLFSYDNAGEPSIGINPNTGALLYQASSETYKVTFNDATTPATASWSDVTPLTNVINLDPILATDPSTGRTFAGGLMGPCSVLSYTDNDGGSWTQVANPCSGTDDHETIGSGPWAGAAPLGYTGNRTVYYCAQHSVDACSTSIDGGRTFGPPVPVLGACNYLHGHVKVSADGTAYVPDNFCGSNVGGAITRDNGQTWNSYAISQATADDRGFDPSIATTPDNTAYEAWSRAGDHHPMIARSTNHGTSWDRVTDLAGTVSPGIVASTFQAVVAGDNGRVAVAYLGTSTGSGLPWVNGYHGVWYLYVSYSYDAGQTWTTVKASADPVQRGCIWDGGGSNACRNILDFMDAGVTPDGRVVVGYADGCVGTCAGANGTEAQSTSAIATIARQSTGKGLYAAYDTAGGNNAPTACFTHSETGLGTSVNGTCSSDPEGPLSSWSWSWGDGSANGSGSTASHTYATAGTYTVGLTVTDSGGLTSTTSQSVTVSSGGGGTDPDPSTPNLTNGTASNGTSAATSGTWQYYKVQVPAGTSSLSVDLATSQSCGVLGCNPDLDLYVRNGAKPTSSAYDCSPQSSSSTENCTISSPAAAWWYVGVYVYSGSTAQPYTIKATF
jgi:PKD repeat protein